MRKIRLLLTFLVAAGTLLAVSPGSAFPSTQAEEASSELVLLLHGLGRSNVSMWWLARHLEEAGYQVYPVGYSSIHSTPEEIIRDVSRQIQACCSREARTVHFVGHSLGGLLIRAYLQEHRLEPLGNVVLIGTPNKGIGMADRFRNNALVKFLLPVATALGTDAQSLPNRLDAPYYPVGVIAGFRRGERYENYLPGQDDGLVTVESIRLEGMSDFVAVESGHSMLRYNGEAVRQTLFFLANGRFLHE